MIYYPMTTLMLAGIREIVVVSASNVIPQLQACLRDGSQWGIELSYANQPSPDGIAHALLAAAKHIEGQPVALILGDNLFYRSGLATQLISASDRGRGATIFAYPVSHPERFGVVVLDEKSRPVAIDEKPLNPRSNLAVPGLYFYDMHAVEYTRTLRKSERGELEITDLNRIYLERGELFVEELGRGSAWLDGGTPDQLFEASQFVRVIEERTGLKIACPEEVAFRMGFVSATEMAETISRMKACDYRSYVERILASK